MPELKDVSKMKNPRKEIGAFFNEVYDKDHRIRSNIFFIDCYPLFSEVFKKMRCPSKASLKF